MKVSETILRTIIKTLLLRVLVFITIMFFVVVILQESFLDGIQFGILDIIIELFVHYIYERIWLKISWGKIITSNSTDIGTQIEII